MQPSQFQGFNGLAVMFVSFDHFLCQSVRNSYGTRFSIHIVDRVCGSLYFALCLSCGMRTLKPMMQITFNNFGGVSLKLLSGQIRIIENVRFTTHLCRRKSHSSGPGAFCSSLTSF